MVGAAFKITSTWPSRRWCALACKKGFDYGHNILLFGAVPCVYCGLAVAASVDIHSAPVLPFRSNWLSWRSMCFPSILLQLHEAGPW